MVTLSPARTRMRLRRSLPAKWAKTIRSCSSCTLNSPLGNFSNTVPVTSIQSSLLINLQAWDRMREPAAAGRPVRRNPLGQSDVGRLQPLGALGYLKLHFCALIQRAIPLRLDGGEVYEHVLSVLPLDKAVALGCVEPLHCAFFFHRAFSFFKFHLAADGPL